MKKYQVAVKMSNIHYIEAESEEDAREKFDNQTLETMMKYGEISTQVDEFNAIEVDWVKTKEDLGKFQNENSELFTKGDVDKIRENPFNEKDFDDYNPRPSDNWGFNKN